MRLLRNFILKRSLLIRSVGVEIKSQHAGTVLGMAWIILGPLLLLALYAVIYSVVYSVKLRGYSQSEYIINLFSGLVLFIAFSQSMSSSTNCLIKDQKLIFTNFPVEFIPTKAVAVSYLVLVPSSIFVVLADLFLSAPTWHLLFLVVVATLQLMFSVGLGCLLSLLGLVLRDISFLIQYITIALLVVTPIAYTPEMIPNNIKPLLYMNPLYYYVSANQHLVLVNDFPPPLEIFICFSMSVSMFLMGIFIFKRARMAMMDLI